VSPPSDSSWSKTTQSTAISPDGAVVFYVWRDLPAGVMELRRLDFDGSNPQTIWSTAANNSSGIANMRYSPDGQRLWFAPCGSGGCRIASINPDGSDYQEHATAVAAGWFDLR
jgi:Tol biopolymer transport system component